MRISQAYPTLATQLLDQEIRKSTPSTHFEYVRVTFNPVANTDTDIVHGLNTTDVDYHVVGLAFLVAPPLAPCIYRNIAGTARAWGTNYLILRSNVASLQATLLLTARREAAL